VKLAILFLIAENVVHVRALLPVSLRHCQSRLHTISHAEYKYSMEANRERFFQIINQLETC
jgi:hypothetical protein